MLLKAEQIRSFEDEKLTVEESDTDHVRFRIGNRALSVEYDDDRKQLIITNDGSLPLYGMIDTIHSVTSDLHEGIKKRGNARSKFYNNLLEAGRASRIFNLLIDHHAGDNASALETEVVEEKGKIRLDMPHAAHHLLTQKERCEAPKVFHSAGSQFCEMLSFLEKKKEETDFPISNSKSRHITMGYALFNALIAVTHKDSVEYPPIPDAQSPITYDDGLFHVQYTHDSQSKTTYLQSNRPLPFRAMKEWYLQKVKEFGNLKPNKSGEYIIQSQDIAQMSQWSMLMGLWAENEDSVNVKKIMFGKQSANGLPCITLNESEYAALCRQMNPDKSLQESKARR